MASDCDTLDCEHEWLLAEQDEATDDDYLVCPNCTAMVGLTDILHELYWDGPMAWTPVQKATQLWRLYVTVGELILGS